jgi:hypothetical protein
MIVPWIRRLLVTIGPIGEWSNATNGAGDIIQILSDGTQNTLRITATINKTIMGIPSPSTICLYNLSRATRTALQTTLSKLTLSAGWNNTALSKEFQGSILACYTERQGPDLITTIIALQGVGPLIKSTVSKTYIEGAKIKDIVKDIAGSISGISLSESNIKGIDGVIGSGGWSFSGSAKDALTALASEYGFSWTVDDGCFYFLGDAAKFSGIVVLDGDNGGLMNVSPILSGPLQMQTGVNIKAVFVPGVLPGSTVRIKSNVMSKLNGDYRVHTQTISLDCYSDTWNMNIESFAYM